MTLFPYTMITAVVSAVIIYKLCWRLYNWNDAAIKRRDAHRRILELDAAIQRARATTPPPPPAPPQSYRNPITGTAGEWDHIPRIAFDLDTQLEFGGSRYHTHLVTPDMANQFWEDWGTDLPPGLYITDKRTGPELIGAPTKKRHFIPYDQLIHQ